MATDIDRLFNSVDLIMSGKPRPRGIGVTFAYEWLLSNDIWNQNANVYLYVTHDAREAQYVQRNFENLVMLISKNWMSTLHESPRGNHCSVKFLENRFIFTHVDSSTLRGSRFNKIYLDVPTEPLIYHHSIFNTGAKTLNQYGRKDLYNLFSNYLIPNGIII